jgi:hypothetical protein
MTSTFIQNTHSSIKRKMIKSVEWNKTTRSVLSLQRRRCAIIYLYSLSFGATSASRERARAREVDERVHAVVCACAWVNCRSLTQTFVRWRCIIFCIWSSVSGVCTKPESRGTLISPSHPLTALLTQWETDAVTHTYLAHRAWWISK